MAVVGPDWILRACRFIGYLHILRPGTPGGVFVSDLSEDELVKVEAWVASELSAKPSAEVSV